jgi:hypothetical protein
MCTLRMWLRGPGTVVSCKSIESVMRCMKVNVPRDMRLHGVVHPNTTRATTPRARLLDNVYLIVAGVVCTRESFGSCIWVT